MKKVLSILCFSFLLMSCASENQQKALAKVADVYNAKTGFSKGFSTSVGQEKITYFRIKVSDSDIIENLILENVASNVAIMVYNDLTEEEKKDYTNIEVEITKKDTTQEKVLRNFKLEELANPAKQVTVFETLSNAVMNNDFELMANLIEPQYRQPQTAEKMSAYFKNFSSQNGKIESYKRTQFALRNIDGVSYYVYSGFFLFENGKHLNYNLETHSDINNKYVTNIHVD